MPGPSQQLKERFLLQNELTPLTLADLDAVALMDRVDTKYLVDSSQLNVFIEALRGDYGALEIGGRRSFDYDTEYFDTPDFSFYLAHHNGRAGREKVRIRLYEDSNIRFLERKRKNNRGRTKKERIDLLRSAGEDAERWLDEHCSIGSRQLNSVLLTRFERLTLASVAHRERITVDANLRFRRRRTQRTLKWCLGSEEPEEYESLALANEAVRDLCIVEVKSRRGAGGTPATRALVSQRLRPRSFSKYCMGVALHRADAKKNAFLPTLRWLQGEFS